MHLWTHTERHVSPHTDRETKAVTDDCKNTPLGKPTQPHPDTPGQTHQHLGTCTHRETNRRSHHTHPNSRKQTWAVCFLFPNEHECWGLHVTHTDKTYKHRSQTPGMNGICEGGYLSMCVCNSWCVWCLVTGWLAAPVSGYARWCPPAKVPDCWFLPVCVGLVCVCV